MNKKILSLFDWSGEWSRPYAKAGYAVITVDMQGNAPRIKNRKHYSMDVMNIDWQSDLLSLHDLQDVVGILAAVPCTDFALSGARWFKNKDADGRTQKSIELTEYVLDIIEEINPKFWAVENPASRIHKLVPRLGSPSFKFSPYEFGQIDGANYRKQTWLWGKFNKPQKCPIEPEAKTTYGMGLWYLKYGGKSDKTKRERSITPKGFAKAFFEANNPIGEP